MLYLLNTYMPISAKRNVNDPNIATKDNHIHKSEFTKYTRSKVNCIGALIEQSFEIVHPLLSGYLSYGFDEPPLSPLLSSTLTGAGNSANR